MAVTVKENSIIIENDLLKREIFLSSKKITGFAFTNKKNGEVLEAMPGSEEFVVSLKRGFLKKFFCASNLKIKSITQASDESTSVLRLNFASFSYASSKISLSVVYALGKDDFFIKKHLEFSFDKVGKKDIVLDYIDFESICFESSNFWCLPKQESSHIPGFALSLGQPVYVDSFFFGCEFPACLSTVSDSRTSVKYYSGKSLLSLVDNGVYKSHTAVSGCGEGSTHAQVQRAFFAYIATLSKPVKLRRQYNSWYDNMLNISRENVTASFTEIEKGLRESGEMPLDSFVADDGWNDYTKGFWCFNEKFPNGLSEFAALSESFGSRFGLWLGPRGGYTNDTPKFAKQIEKAGNGYYNRVSMDICVASEKYKNKTEKLLCDFQRDYNLNYFKLDGFARMPCKNKNHDHMVGGYKNMYFYSDVWEKWLGVFEKLKKQAGDELFINLTCYAPPSAWLLRWVDSLWMQISDDVGFVGKKNQVSDKDRMLTYRDGKYYEFYKTRQFQFPQSHLYNHDPIFGNEAKVSMTDDEFRQFLYTCAARGTSFWELYYSHSMMNEAKWRINHAVLRFIEKNMQVLSHSVIFGNPLEGPYGYAAFGDDEGILCVRNSTSQKTDYEVKLDEQIGVSPSFKRKTYCVVLPYAIGESEKSFGYGDTFKVSLDAYGTVIYHFGRKPAPLSAVYAETVDERTVKVRFDGTVGIDGVRIDGNEIVSAELFEDYMTAEFKLRYDIVGMKHTLTGVKDLSGSEYAVEFMI